MSGEFLAVRCPDCDNEQTVFSKASTEVACTVCGTVLVAPTGGEAEFSGEVIEVVGAR